MTPENILISVVSPVYGSLNALPELVKRITESISPITQDFEIILVDDRGPGDAWNIISDLSKQNSQIKGVKLSRNFGQHYAITAGLDHCKGEWVVVMDCDLQDPPESIPNLYQTALKENASTVWAVRTERKHSFFKQMGSRLFYKTLSWLTGIEYDHRIANFGIYHRRVIDAVCALKENIRFFPSMVRWVGFDSTTMEVIHGERTDGDSSYSFSKLMNLALDIMLAYSDKPLRMAVKLGLFISLSSVLLIVITIVRYALGVITVEGYFSTILSLWLLGGIIIFILGIVGLYIGKTFEGVKERPVYIVEEVVEA